MPGTGSGGKNVLKEDRSGKKTFISFCGSVKKLVLQEVFRVIFKLSELLEATKRFPRKMRHHLAQ